MAESDKLSKEDLRALAAELDTSGNRAVEPEAQDAEPPQGDMALEDTSQRHLSQEEAEKEYEKQHPKETEDDKKAADSSDTIDVEAEVKQPKDQKDQDRFDRNWKKMQEREKAAALDVNGADQQQHMEMQHQDNQPLARPDEGSAL
jgi:hypothetical protein